MNQSLFVCVCVCVCVCVFYVESQRKRQAMENNDTGQDFADAQEGKENSWRTGLLNEKQTSLYKKSPAIANP